MVSQSASAGLGHRRSRPALLALATLLLALLAGCAERDHITVGSVPDDYRTNHPIVISDREKVLDVPIGAAALRLSRGQRSLVAGFLSGYDRETGAPMRILVPANSANAASAFVIAGEIEDIARASGVHGGNILVQTYQVSTPEASAPIRVTYYALAAGTDQCGRWPEDMLAKSSENKHWANFGCSYQNNLAAQVANPTDLIGPRATTSVDPENRANAIDQYKSRGVSQDFGDQSEISY
jgi:pilus assembly protein CpaD